MWPRRIFWNMSVRLICPRDGRSKRLWTLFAKKVAALARQRLKDLRYRHVSNAAVLVIERETGNILAWAVESSDKDTAAVNAVLAPRQPASAQKPLLYALALTKGMTAATKIKDAPFARAVGSGVHHFKNYSRSYYGDVTVRQALGNSLNIPALKTIEFVGIKTYFGFLQRLGFSHFEKSADFYREGLALGNAEVTLLELSRAYLMLAGGGVLKPLRAFKEQDGEKEKRMLPETAATLIGNILSDPLARQLEFGADSILNFPVQTAVKTGTSTDYRDAWAMGYNADFVAGVWLGNLTYEPMLDVTGASGPALLLRSVFTELNKIKNSGPLPLSARLEKEQSGKKRNTLIPTSSKRHFLNLTRPSLFRLPTASCWPSIPACQNSIRVIRFPFLFCPKAPISSGLLTKNRSRRRGKKLFSGVRKREVIQYGLK